MAKVYVSSTVVDLKAERQAVIDWLIQARHQPVHSYLPDSETVRDSCLADIDGCDLYVLILGHRYGFVPEADNPEGLSITHLEFRRALERGMPRVALLRTNVPDIQLSDLLDPKRSQQVQAFHAEVNSKMRAAQFSNLAELIAALSAGVQNELAKHALQPANQAPANKPLPMPVLHLPQHPIVGRGKLVEKVLADLRAGQLDFAFEYLPGVGKTALAAVLIRNKDILERFPDGVLWAHLGPGPDVRRQLRKWAKALGLSNDEIADCDGLADLRDAVAQVIGERRIMLVVDDVWTTEAGQYFMLGGPTCARMITTRYRKIARELMPTIDAVQEVRKLDADDGFQLLAELAPHAAQLAPDLLHQLVERVDGLPIALVLIGKLLKNNGDNEQALHSAMQSLTNIDQIFREKKLQEYREDYNFSLGEVVEASYSALGTAGTLSSSGLPGDQLRAALEALAILRPDPAWFTTTLALLVSEAPAQALTDLADAGLIEAVHYSSEDEKTGSNVRYTMHRVIAEYIRTKLSPQRLQILNRRAADYYLEQLTQLEESYQNDKSTTYSVMYRYEDPDWQDCQDNWLYYFAQTGYDTEASLSFLRVWFDGFWWWSCFTAEGFDFCDQLLLEWDHKLALTANGLEQALPPAAQQGGRLERLIQGIDLLRRFKRAYPKETEDRSGGSWPEVVTTLRTLCSLAKLDGDLAQLGNPNARHVRALTDVFLAEAERFGGGDLAIAEFCYREALALFREAKDDWNIAWMLYHLSDMLSTLGRRDEVRTLCAEALTFGHAGGDYEVIALIHRVLGDCALADQRIDEALHNYRLALEHAYRFQVQPENPDPYTIQFYSDMAQRVAERLLSAHATFPDHAQHIAHTLRQAWLDCGVELAAVPNESALLAGTTVELLARRLFPPTLSLEKLKVDELTYANSVRGHLMAVEQREAQRAVESLAVN